MAIRFSTPPSESDDAVRHGLAEIAQTHAGGIRAEAVGGAIDPTSFTSPHQVYFARLDDLKQGKGVGSAKPQGWRYFVGPLAGRAAEVAAGDGEPLAGRCRSLRAQRTEILDPIPLE